ncbi:MAG: hypothetical protein JNM95_02535 [Chitinophagaceae bacterium]|nr:hypothetical protein [Chitinophagaceae bacterium]
MTNNKIIQTNLVEPAFEEQIISYASEEGRQHGLKNEPKTDVYFKATIVNHIQTKIQSELDRANTETGPIAQKVAAAEFELQSRKQMEKDKSIRNQLEHESKKSELIINSCRIPSSRRWKKIIGKIILAGLALTDGSLFYYALIGLSISSIISAISSLFISGGIYAYTSMVAAFIGRAKTNRDKWIRGTWTSAVIFVVYYIIGYFRNVGMSNNYQLESAIAHNQGDVPTTHSALMLAILSTFIYLSGLLLTLKLQLSDDEKKLEEACNNAKKEYDKKQREINTITKSMEAQEAEIQKRNHEANQRLEKEAQRERAYVSLAEVALQEYINHNIRYRHDGLTPEFFVIRPNFNFQLFINPILKNNLQ